LPQASYHLRTFVTHQAITPGLKDKNMLQNKDNLAQYEASMVEGRSEWCPRTGVYRIKLGGPNNGIVVTIQEDNALKYDNGSSKPGETGSMRVDQFNNFIATIKLNGSYFQGTSVESVAATLIHEFVHAYIGFKADPLLSQSHDQLAAKYVSPMAEFLSSKFNLTPLQGYALAWSGLGDSQVMKNSTPDTQFQMSNGTLFKKSDIVAEAAPFNYQGSGSKGTPICKD
jgi:hypothetical protein